jgi:uncharacterized protein YjbJ (UPF0337 family)
MFAAEFGSPKIEYRLGSALKPFKGQAKQLWGQLPHDGFQELARRRDRLARLFQERHGMDRNEADRQINQWLLGSV